MGRVFPVSSFLVCPVEFELTFQTLGLICRRLVLKRT